MSKKRPADNATSAVPEPLASPFASLEIGGLPPGPEQAPAEAPPSAPPGGGRLVIRKEKSGRGGKTVLVVSGFPRTWSSARIAEWVSRLKRSLGTGGSARGGEMEIQGDVADRLRPLLEREGFRVAGPG